MNSSSKTEAWLRVLAEAKKQPGKRFKDPRFSIAIPACPAPTKELAEYLDLHFSGFEFFGPQACRTEARLGDQLVLRSDLTGNGLDDYAALIRMAGNPKTCKLVVFLQGPAAAYTHAELGFPASVSTTYLLLADARYVRSAAGLRDRDNPDGWVYNPNIRDTTRCLIASNHYRHRIAFCWHDGEFRGHCISC